MKILVVGGGVIRSGSLRRVCEFVDRIGAGPAKRNPAPKRCVREAFGAQTLVRIERARAGRQASLVVNS